MRISRISFFALAFASLLVSSLPCVSEAGGKHGALQLTGAQVIPGPGDASGSASASVKVGRNYVTFYVTVGPIDGFIQTIGIYEGPAGQSGPMVLRLSPSGIGINQLNGTVTADPNLCRLISRSPSSYYIQINTTAYPDGALRSQLQ
jgi:hypothetical protein